MHVVLQVATGMGSGVRSMTWRRSHVPRSWCVMLASVKARGV